MRVSAEIVFRTRRPMTPNQLGHAVARALGPEARDTLVVQGTEIKVVCILPPGQRLDEALLEVVSVEAEPMDGPRY